MKEEKGVGTSCLKRVLFLRAVIVWLQCCWHANTWEQEEEEAARRYLQRAVTALLVLSDTVSNTNHFKCWDITWLYRRTTILYDCTAISIIPDQFSHITRLLPAHYSIQPLPLRPLGKMKATEGKGERDESQRGTTALYSLGSSKGPKNYYYFFLTTKLTNKFVCFWRGKQVPEPFWIRRKSKSNVADEMKNLELLFENGVGELCCHLRRFKRQSWLKRCFVCLTETRIMHSEAFGAKEERFDGIFYRD